MPAPKLQSASHFTVHPQCTLPSLGPEALTRASFLAISPGQVTLDFKFPSIHWNCLFCIPCIIKKLSWMCSLVISYVSNITLQHSIFLEGEAATFFVLLKSSPLISMHGVYINIYGDLRKGWVYLFSATLSIFLLQINKKEKIICFNRLII